MGDIDSIGAPDTPNASPTRVRDRRASTGNEVNMDQRFRNRAVATVALAVCVIGGIGCGSKIDQNAVASLPDLPQADLAKLTPVAHSTVLATSDVHRLPAEPPAIGPPSPSCPQDASRTTLSVDVTYPVTVCAQPPVDVAVVGVVFVERRGPTHKLADARLPTEMRRSPQAPQNVNAFWGCRMDSGPWQGLLTEEHGCSGTWRPLNTLTLIDTPNVVFWGWYGRRQDHPSDFQFASNPVQISDDDLGACHGKKP